MSKKFLQVLSMAGIALSCNSYADDATVTVKNDGMTCSQDVSSCPSSRALTAFASGSNIAPGKQGSMYLNDWTHLWAGFDDYWCYPTQQPSLPPLITNHTYSIIVEATKFVGEDAACSWSIKDVTSNKMSHP